MRSEEEIEVAVRMHGSGDVVRAKLGVTVHAPQGAARSGVAIIYLHGGGLLFGSRDDLPHAYIEQILDRGHALICLDYPLAPQTGASDIVSSIACALDRIAICQPAGLDCTDYVLFGRSAGAYLALMVAARAQRRRPVAGSERDFNRWRAPLAVWDFYGYTDLLAPFAREPSPYYAKMPAVDEKSAERTIALEPGVPLTSATMAKRFSLYVYARQTGRWPELVGADEADAESPRLTETAVAGLPPLFIAASTTDRDVPFEVSKRLSRAAPHTELHTVYYLEHDFDRDPEEPAGPQAYASALDFLDTCRSATLPMTPDG